MIMGSRYGREINMEYNNWRKVSLGIRNMLLLETAVCAAVATLLSLRRWSALMPSTALSTDMWRARGAPSRRPQIGPQTHNAKKRTELAKIRGRGDWKWWKLRTSASIHCNNSEKRFYFAFMFAFIIKVLLNNTMMMRMGAKFDCFIAIFALNSTCYGSRMFFMCRRWWSTDGVCVCVFSPFSSISAFMMNFYLICKDRIPVSGWKKRRIYYRSRYVNYSTGERFQWKISVVSIFPF